MRRTSELPFEIRAWGEFQPARVRVVHDPTPRASTHVLDALIADEWQRQTAAASLAGRILFNGDMLRYISHLVEQADGAARLHLTVGPTCYRDFVGTNLYNSHRLGEFGWERFANPVGTTATLLTSDGLICYGRRSQRVAFHAGHVHTFGGALEARDRSADGSIDAFASLCRELAEELGIAPGELFNLRCVGLIRDGQIHQPEMLFEAELGLSSRELDKRWQSAEARDEHDELVCVPDQPETIVPFIQRCGLIAPVAIGGLLIHGRLRWGEEWFARAAEEMAGGV